MTEISKLTGLSGLNSTSDLKGKDDIFKADSEKLNDKSIWNKSGEPNKADSSDCIFKIPNLEKDAIFGPIPFNPVKPIGIYMPIPEADTTPLPDGPEYINLPQEDFLKNYHQ